jgi:hypothetical protein
MRLPTYPAAGEHRHTEANSCGSILIGNELGSTSNQATHSFEKAYSKSRKNLQPKNLSIRSLPILEQRSPIVRVQKQSVPSTEKKKTPHALFRQVRGDESSSRNANTLHLAWRRHPKSRFGDAHPCSSLSTLRMHPDVTLSLIEYPAKVILSVADYREPYPRAYVQADI